MIAPGGYEADWSGLYANGGGARQLGEYFHVVGREGEGEEGLALFAWTVSESTTYFSILDCRLAKSSAPFPLKAGISKADPIPVGDIALLVGIGDGTFVPNVYEPIRCRGAWVV